MTGPQAFVYIHLGGVDHIVGTLWAAERPGRSSFTFQYADAWAENPVAFEIDPGLPLVGGRKAVATRLFGGLADSAPDRWGRTLLARAERLVARRAGRAVRTLTERDYVLGVADVSRSGALRFAASEGGPFLAPPEADAVPPLVELPRLLAAAQGFLDNPDSEGDLGILLAPGSCLGGARPKASVRHGDGRLSIANFPKDDDLYSIGAWEHLTL